MTKNKLSKLTLRRETLTALDLQQANGGAISLVNSAVRSVCLICYPRPVITEHLTWPIEEQTIAGPSY